jgi:hypothetical protein
LPYSRLFSSIFINQMISSGIYLLMAGKNRVGGKTVDFTSDKPNTVEVWHFHPSQRADNPYSALVAERRKAENAAIRRWVELGEKALDKTASDDDLTPAA